MRSHIFVVLTTILITGCGNNYQELGKKEVESKLSDPLSAQYRNVKEYSYGVVCGEVNSKNKYGGYDGFKRFVFFGFGDDIEGGYTRKLALPANSSDWALWCTNEKDKGILSSKREVEYYRDKCPVDPYNTKNCSAEHERITKDIEAWRKELQK